MVGLYCDESCASKMLIFSRPGHRYSLEIPVLLFLYTYPCNGIFSHGTPIGGIRVFSDHTRRNKMRPRSSCAMRRFTSLPSRLDRSTLRTWRITLILITGKIWTPEFEPHAGIKMAQVLGSPVYICGPGSHEWQHAIYCRNFPFATICWQSAL